MRVDRRSFIRRLAGVAVAVAAAPQILTKLRWQKTHESKQSFDTVALRSGNWHDPRIWSRGYVPRPYENVHIPAGVTVTVTNPVRFSK